MRKRAKMAGWRQGKGWSGRLLVWPLWFAIVLAGWAGVASGAEETGEMPIHRVQNMFVPHSTPAEMILEAAWVVLIACAAIFVVVAGLLAYAIWRFRARASDGDQEPPQVYGSIQIEMAWTVIPVIITLMLILVTARTIGQIQSAPIPENAERVRLVGHQWWWEVHYPEYGFTTANEIHVPVDHVTHFLLQSADVIHSFWVPMLAGKTDCIPNRDNETWIEPKQLGIYLGNCAEYCGTQHAGMRLRVVVQSRDAFDAWVKQQQAAATVDAAVESGRNTFFNTSCVNCHQIAGTEARGVFGPDLTKFATRQTLGAGAAPLDREHLREWLRDPARLKPGVLMPDMSLTQQEIDDLADYLLSLR